MIERMVIWMSSPEQAALVNLALWVSAIVTILWMVVRSWQQWRFNRKQARRLQAAARAQARLDVFESWLAAGGWSTDLQLDEFNRRMAERNEKAMKHGDDYHAEYCEAREVVEVELDKVLYAYMRLIKDAK